MGAGALIFGLGLIISTVESFTDSGEYTVITKGLVPLHFENEYMKYDAEMTRVNRYDRLLSGNCTVKQHLGPIGIHVKFLKESPSGGTYEATAPLTLEKVCDKGFDENSFLEKFTCEDDPKQSSINLDDCTVEDKRFNLKEWTIEPHIKSGLGKYFFYGDFTFNVTIFGKPDGDKEVEYGIFLLKLSIVNKKWDDHQKGQRKKNGNKKGHEEEDVTDPGTHSDPEKYKDPKNYKPPKF